MRALFNRLNFRRLFVVLGVLMHLGVFVLIGLGPFTWISLSFYACLFRPEEWSRFVHSMAGRINDPTFDRQPQGEYEQREELL